MPTTTVVFFQNEDGTVPMIEWLDGLPAKALDKCMVRIERLAVLGHEIRRPEADFLRDGIYELRIGLQHVNYRILYFFHQNFAVVLSHGLTKEKIVPNREIEKALARKRQFEADPERHTYVK
jgi:phage-related protein